MRLSIKHKLLLTILATISLVVVTIHLVGQWSFQRGFIRFVNSAEQARLEQLAEELENLYATEGDWSGLRDRPARWIALLQRTGDRRALPPRAADRLMRQHMHDMRRMPHREMRPEKMRHFEARVILFDADQKLLFGFPQLFKERHDLPLQVKGEVIGHLGLAPQKQLADDLQLQFLEEQHLTFTLIAFGIVLLAALLTLPITGRLVRPIRALATATRELTKGDYKTRAPVSSDDELGQLSRDFNALAATLEQNEQARRQWVADISHELRTPLAVLRGEIEAVQDQVRDLTPQTLKSLHGEVLHLNRLISDLYELSMSDLGALTYKKVPVNPVAILRNAADLYRQRFTAQNIDLIIDLEEGRGTEILADPERLLQLFTNLLENSLRYTDSGGRVELRSTISGQALILNQLDSTPGVPEADLPKLFDRLYRVDTSRSREAGGAGLGLSICRNIVEGHGGSIEAQASPLGGLWLSINLPLNG